MNIDLSLFLRNVADMLDSDKLNNKELKLVGEFYMSFKFQNNVIDKFRKFLNSLNTPYLITNFSEYQGNNHKHYHSQLFINKAHLNTIKAYCKKNIKNIFVSELINFEYVVKEIKPKFLKFNSNLKNYK